MDTADKQEILRVTQELLDAIAAADWQTYERLCDSQLTAFEPEAKGHLVEGLPFHRFYFDRQAYVDIACTISSPHIRILGPDAALIAYIRLNQFLDGDGRATTTCFEETRLWERRDGRWLHVHFHRS